AAPAAGAAQVRPQRNFRIPETPAGQPPRRPGLPGGRGRMNAENARAQVFGDSLVCEETRAAAFVPMEFDPAAVRAASLRAEALLHSIAIIEDGKVEDTDERGAHEHALQRVEAKLDLLTSLVATLVSSHRP